MARAAEDGAVLSAWPGQGQRRGQQEGVRGRGRGFPCGGTGGSRQGCVSSGGGGFCAGGTAPALGW
eukprot:3947372-Pleurochrysis_carterae.AAC.1